ncbi:hypothetical protein Cni_G29091 [Canna indica]|uniref:Uncharacterized protein n=1 Tax=Canna indica TaxID=4628 RepID=A0AAQ3L6L2_9LILI|nr:hypothetical protein Cni_G29091 [Canna indica]
MDKGASWFKDEFVKHKEITGGHKATCETDKVCSLRRIDLVRGSNKEHKTVGKNARNVDVVNLDSNKKPAAGTSTFDSNRTSKRRVRRGSDPIHNRC